MAELKFIKEDEFEKLFTGKIPVFAEFWTPECLACEISNPFLIELLNSYEGKLEVVKINTQRCPNLMKKYTINVWPTFIMFKNGREMFKVQGFRNGIEIEKQIRQNLN